MNKQIGIWLDLRQANIIKLESDQSKVQNIESDIEDFHPVGGARSKTPYGPMDTVSEKTFLERKKHQLSKYFDKIIKVVENCDSVLIFGPAETKNQLKSAIKSQKTFKINVTGTKSADSMTENQKVAFARKYFANKSVLDS